MKLTINNCIYHRNGISGIAFYAVEFYYEEKDEKGNGIATIDADDLVRKEPYNPGTRILMLDPWTGGIVVEQTMRGDNFHKPLCEAIRKHQRGFHRA